MVRSLALTLGKIERYKNLLSRKWDDLGEKGEKGGKREKKEVRWKFVIQERDDGGSWQVECRGDKGWSGEVRSHWGEAGRISCHIAQGIWKEKKSWQHHGFVTYAPRKMGFHFYSGEASQMNKCKQEPGIQQRNFKVISVNHHVS